MLVLLLLPFQVLAQDDFQNPVFQCTEEELLEERETCFGELGPIIPDQPFCSDVKEPYDCCDTEADTERHSCWGELISATEGDTTKTTTPSTIKCPADTTAGTCRTVIAINTTCLPCSAPKPLNNKNTLLGPKVVCDGKTVYNQQCTTIGATNKSSCMMGSEGFSWCSTVHLFWRDDHWFDWDLCSLCAAGSEQRVLTSNGFECDGPCTNSHNNFESLAPRCKIKNPELDPAKIGMDFCTTCEGENCPDVPRDERPGSQVGKIKWNSNIGGDEEEDSSEDEYEDEEEEDEYEDEEEEEDEYEDEEEY